ncbi:hypothetical protein [Gymnodinialimonas sp.]
MTFSSKAIFAALVLSLTPAVASAQNDIYPIFPSPGGAQINGVAIPQQLQGGMQVLLAPGVIGTPVQAQDCGAQQYQRLLGHHVTVAQSYGIAARYFTPDSPYGTMNYLPYRLNISTDAHYVIDRVYCG